MTSNKQRAPVARSSVVLAMMTMMACGGTTSSASTSNSSNIGTATKTGEQTLYIADAKVDCVGVEPRQCLRVRSSPDAEWEYFYNDIEGFAYEEGHAYTLRVDVRKVNNPPADGSSLHYLLLEVVSKSPR